MALNDGFVCTANRPIQEISQDLKMAAKKLLDATKKAEEAEKDRMRAIIEILNLQRELEMVNQ
jgi:hypothetical protein